ncbi:MAG: hypothetical protein ACI3V3_04180 [Faecousia sp.]
MKRLFLFLMATFMLLPSCYESAKTYDDGYEEGYSHGHESGYEIGYEEGQQDLYRELVDDGILKKVEIVFLSSDGSKIYHSFYCDKANHDIEVYRETAEENGFVPCDECGGNGFGAYAPNT